MKRSLLLGTLLLLALFGMNALAGSGARIEVRAGEDLQAVIDAAGPGDEIVLGAGTYQGPLKIDRPLRLTGEGAVVSASPSDASALVITASDVSIEGLSVRGAETGISVREAEGVALRDVALTGQSMHGIEIVDSSAWVTGARVQVSGEYAQGIEVRNSDGRPDSVIESSSVSGGQEGIVSHVSEVIIRENVVRDSTLRGITVTEMSDGIVRDNQVIDATGAGFYCGDMSRCEFTGNVASAVQANEIGTSGAGWGLLVTYHSSASEADNTFSGAAGRVNVMLASRLTERSPLEPGRGVGAVPYAAAALAAGLALLLIVTWLVGTRATLWARRFKPGLAWVGVGAGVLAVTLLVQSFHMVEHFLQLFRVFVDGVPSRGGLVGPRVEPEWVHLLYNSIFLFGIGAVILSRAAGWGPRTSGADSALGGVFFLQSYHTMEHVVKVVQHFTTGAKVNPGLAGEFTNLVLLHFALNAAVYAGLLYAAASLLLRTTDLRSTRLPAPQG